MIVINTSFRRAPWADMLYACDYPWWEQYIEEVRSHFSGELCSQDERALALGVTHTPGEHKPGLGLNKIHFGGNSGYQAVNLAFLRGAHKIILLGYDMQRTNGMTHWHGDHPGNLSKHSPVESWVQRFKAMALDLKQRGIVVLNASRETALPWFPRESLERALSYEHSMG